MNAVILVDLQTEIRKKIKRENETSHKIVKLGGNERKKQSGQYRKFYALFEKKNIFIFRFPDFISASLYSMKSNTI